LREGIMLFDTITIVGVGLLGGSLGLAAKKRHLVKHIVGVGRDGAKLQKAKDAGIVDEFHTNIRDGVAKSNFVIVCTPVDQIVQDVREVAAHTPKGCLITDVGSTKRVIVETLRAELPAKAPFLGSHPMAGSEKKGSDFADAELFQNRVCIITPTEKCDPLATAKIHDFWQHVGSRVLKMTPEEHDRSVAYVSHLPHVVAAALAGVVDPALLGISAGGFRDTTRIASASPAIWEPIFRTNKEEVLAACKTFAKQFAEFEKLLAAGDTKALIRWLNEGKQVRDALGS
jgi:prephenate dehydrogenase